MAETTDDLIERVERGAGEDRRLDADICIALRIHPYGSGHWLKDRVSSFHHDTNCDGWVQPMDRDGVTPLPGGSWKTGAYTTSLDAVLALIEEKLPGAAFVVHGPDDGWFFGGIGPCLGEAWGDDCSATSPARALLAAALRALKESRHVG